MYHHDSSYDLKTYEDFKEYVMSSLPEVPVIRFRITSFDVTAQDNPQLAQVYARMRFREENYQRMIIAV